MIAIDLDGTLLRHSKKVSAYTASVLWRCVDKGIKVVLATARPIRAVKVLDIPVRFDAAVYHNGAVVDNGSEKMLRIGITPQDIQSIVPLILQTDSQARICIEMDDSIYGNSDVSDVWPGIEINPTDFKGLPLMPADKVIVLTEDRHKLEALRKTLPENLYLEVSENTVGMIMRKEATKANAILQLCEKFCISPDEVIAFGDDHNDIHMLQRCVGVAVANAIEEVKAVADFICDENENDGVAKWIEENLL